MTTELRWKFTCQRCGAEASALHINRIIFTACPNCEAMTVRVDGKYQSSADEIVRLLGREEVERVGRIMRGEE